MESMEIFKAFTISKSIASYLGLIDSVSSDVKKLLHQSFESGKRNLEYAQVASVEIQKLYVQKALSDFINAQSVEKDENLISSYLGTAMCQYILGDIANARISLNKISTVSLSTSEKTKAIAADITFGKEGVILDHKPDLLGLGGFLLRGVMRSFGQKGYREMFRLAAFEEYKSKALQEKI